MHTCWKSGQESPRDEIENQHSKASIHSCLSLTAIPWSKMYFEVKKWRNRSKINLGNRLAKQLEKRKFWHAYLPPQCPNCSSKEWSIANAAKRFRHRISQRLHQRVGRHWCCFSATMNKNKEHHPRHYNMYSITEDCTRPK
jgi:hypothetical protein